MARTPAGGILTAQHREAQLQLRAIALRDYAGIWPLWQGDEESFNQLVAATLPLVRAHHSFSSTLAGAYFESFRRAEKASGAASAVSAAPVNEEQVISSLYVTGRVMTGKALRAGQTPEAAMRTALVRTSGAVTRHVLNGGREAMLVSTREDRAAHGWERVTSPGACGFCSMLAARGAVYSAETVDFRAHDHCACFPEPKF
jgi:hypothetical protein